MTGKKIKLQLHQSHLSLLYRCGYLFEQVVILGRREPPAVPQIVGKAAHATVASDLIHKASTGVLLHKNQIEDLASDNFVKEWEACPVVLNEDEKKYGLKKVKGRSKDMTIKMSVCYNEHIAINIMPKKDGIERKFVLECDGYPYDIAGQIDIDEVTNDIHDNKFRGRAINQREVDTSEQLTVYAMAKMVLDGVKPTRVWLDNVIVRDWACDGLPTVKSLHSARTEADFMVFKNRFEQAVEVIEKGAFTPTSTSNWWCDIRYCGLANSGTCPYFNRGRVTIMPPKRKGESSYGKRIIKTRTEEWCDATR